MSAAESYALELVKTYSTEEKEWLLSLFKTIPWQMLEILNTYHACGGNKEATELCLHTASRHGIHVYDVTQIIHSKLIFPNE